MKLRFSFDPVKNARNIEERGLSFAEAAEFDWSTAQKTHDMITLKGAIKHWGL